MYPANPYAQLDQAIGTVTSTFAALLLGLVFLAISFAPLVTVAVCYVFSPELNGWLARRNRARLQAQYRVDE